MKETVQRNQILTTQFPEGSSPDCSSELGHLGDLPAYQLRTDLKDGQAFLNHISLLGSIFSR